MFLNSFHRSCSYMFQLIALLNPRLLARRAWVTVAQSRDGPDSATGACGLWSSCDCGFAKFEWDAQEGFDIILVSDFGEAQLWSQLISKPGKRRERMRGMTDLGQVTERIKYQSWTPLRLRSSMIQAALVKPWCLPPLFMDASKRTPSQPTGAWAPQQTKMSRLRHSERGPLIKRSAAATIILWGEFCAGAFSSECLSIAFRQWQCNSYVDINMAWGWEQHPMLFER